MVFLLLDVLRIKTGVVRTCETGWLRRVLFLPLKILWPIHRHKDSEVGPTTDGVLGLALALFPLTFPLAAPLHEP